MMHILPATPADIPVLKQLVNSAYRGEASRQGWTTEADIIKGEIRTDEAQLESLFQDSTGTILTCRNAEQEILGCVHLQQQGDKIYLGMLSVWPEQQGFGIGKQLLNAADAYAKEKQCSAVFMRVINLRTELIAWYQRNGYLFDGVTEPFPDFGIYGQPKVPMVFWVLEKKFS